MNNEFISKTYQIKTTRKGTTLREGAFNEETKRMNYNEIEGINSLPEPLFDGIDETLDHLATWILDVDDAIPHAIMDFFEDPSDSLEISGVEFNYSINQVDRTGVNGTYTQTVHKLSYVDHDINQGISVKPLKYDGEIVGFQATFWKSFQDLKAPVKVVDFTDGEEQNFVFVPAFEVDTIYEEKTITSKSTGKEYTLQNVVGNVILPNQQPYEVRLVAFGDNMKHFENMKVGQIYQLNGVKLDEANEWTRQIMLFKTSEVTRLDSTPTDLETYM